MRAEFHVSGGLDIVVGNEPGGVSLTIFRGVCHEHSLMAPDCKERTVEKLSIRKHHARALASAMMGCAAEA